MFGLAGRLSGPVKLVTLQCGSIRTNIFKNDFFVKLYTTQQLPLCKTLCFKSDNGNCIGFGSQQIQRATIVSSNFEKIFRRGISLFQNRKTNQLCRGAYVDELNNIKLNQTIRNLTIHQIDKPDPNKIKKNLRFKVHYPEDGKYTIQPLQMTRLGGRDPETGRIIYGKIGGGHKRNFRWVIYDRLPAGSKDPLVERVLHVQYDPNRTARIALVGHDDKLRYIIATANMKKGDLITSTRDLPRMHIRPNIGDAHPVGALPYGTSICCIEKFPGDGARVKLAAGASATVMRKLEGKVVVQLDSLRDVALDENCLVTVGQVSNPDHNKKPIGSPNRLRWLGFRPSSGLWQRKDGRYGFKRKQKGAPKHYIPDKTPTPVLKLTLLSEQVQRKLIPCTDRVT